MRGFVPTPDQVVDLMIERLFENRQINEFTRILDPGCGTGVFIEGIIRWCQRYNFPIPQITGIELDPHRAKTAKNAFKNLPTISIVNGDFLIPSEETFDFIVGNPPYVSILELTEFEKNRYKDCYITATGRFDLYMLFFEQAIKQLKENGRLVFITPEKFTYTESAASTRSLLTSLNLSHLIYLNEDTFPGLATYPVVSVVDKKKNNTSTLVIDRNLKSSNIVIPKDGSNWLTALSGKKPVIEHETLADHCHRISCGIATGADDVFVLEKEAVPKELRNFAFPTISGRQLNSIESVNQPTQVMLSPYDRNGKLITGQNLKLFCDFLEANNQKPRLLARTCAKRKPWYAFHDSVPMHDVLKPKILCKDITDNPTFWVDLKGQILPRHSIYYLIPKDSSRIEELANYLNADSTKKWLLEESQRAANGFIRLQSSVLKRIPILRNAFQKQQHINPRNVQHTI